MVWGLIKSAARLTAAVATGGTSEVVAAAVTGDPAAVAESFAEDVRTVGDAFDEGRELAGEVTGAIDELGDFVGSFGNLVTFKIGSLDIPLSALVTPTWFLANDLAGDALQYYTLEQFNRWEQLLNSLGTLSPKDIWNNPLGELRELTFNGLDLSGIVSSYEFARRALNVFDRPLSDEEKAAAEEVFGSAIDLNQVRVNESGPIESGLELLFGDQAGAYTTFHTINTWKADPSVALIMHELVHVWQYEEFGADYLARALFDAQQGFWGYDYGGPDGLRSAMDTGRGLVPRGERESYDYGFDYERTGFNFEQMADVVEHYAEFKLNLDGLSTSGNSMYVVSKRGADGGDGQPYYIPRHDLQMYAHFVQEVSSLPLEQLSPQSVTGFDAGHIETYVASNGRPWTQTFSGNDTIYGNRLANDQNGLGGNDTLRGFAGNDTLAGGGGNDDLGGGTDDDLLLGGFGDDILDGGDGKDTASWERDFFGAAVRADLVAGTARRGAAEVDTLRSIENLRGGGQGDTLTGDGAANLLEGLGGRDTLEGGGGADTLDGGDGLDAASFSRAAQGVQADLAAGSAALGAGGTEVLRSIEDALGSAFGDTLSGTGGSNHLAGSAGDDVLTGRGGADSFVGGPGRDIFAYGSLADSGVGPAAADRIADFVQGQDVVSFLPADAFMTWIGAAPFTPVRAGPAFYDIPQIRFRQDGAYTYLEVNADEDLDPELSIEFAGTFALTRDDVLFPEYVTPR